MGFAGALDWPWLPLDARRAGPLLPRAGGVSQVAHMLGDPPPPLFGRLLDVW